MLDKRRTLLLLLFALLLGVQWAFAQAEGSLVGTVRDTSGGLIPAAKVVATRIETGIAYETTANESGDYILSTVPVGDYTVSFTAKGFEELNVENIEIYVASTVRQDATLRVAGVATKVEVVASTPLVKSETAEIGTLVGEQQITELPLDGRDVYGLAQLTAGTETGKAVRDGDPSTMPTIAGGRAGQTLFRMDGVNINTENLPSAGVIPILDSTEEFRVITELSPAWFSDMSVVTVATKSGSNHFHATAYDFLRNNVLDAHTFFQHTINTPTFSSSPPSCIITSLAAGLGARRLESRLLLRGRRILARIKH